MVPCPTLLFDCDITLSLSSTPMSISSSSLIFILQIISPVTKFPRREVHECDAIRGLHWSNPQSSIGPYPNQECRVRISTCNSGGGDAVTLDTTCMCFRRCFADFFGNSAALNLVARGANRQCAPCLVRRVTVRHAGAPTMLCVKWHSYKKSAVDQQTKCRWTLMHRLIDY